MRERARDRPRGAPVASAWPAPRGPRAPAPRGPAGAGLSTLPASPSPQGHARPPPEALFPSRLARAVGPCPRLPPACLRRPKTTHSAPSDEEANANANANAKRKINAGKEFEKV